MAFLLTRISQCVCLCTYTWFYQIGKTPQKSRCGNAAQYEHGMLAFDWLADTIPRVVVFVHYYFISLLPFLRSEV